MNVERAVVRALSEAWDREPDGIWEPAGVPRFQPGDRVRVRISLECDYCLDPKFQQCYERALADNGRTATVYDVDHDECSCRWDDEPAGVDHLGHDVWVTWDERRTYDDPVIESVGFDAHFAPSELILLDESQPRVADGRARGEVR